MHDHAAVSCSEHLRAHTVQPFHVKHVVFKEDEPAGGRNTDGLHAKAATNTSRQHTHCSSWATPGRKLACTKSFKPTAYLFALGSVSEGVRTSQNAGGGAVVIAWAKQWRTLQKVFRARFPRACCPAAQHSAMVWWLCCIVV